MLRIQDLAPLRRSLRSLQTAKGGMLSAMRGDTHVEGSFEFESQQPRKEARWRAQSGVIRALAKGRDSMEPRSVAGW